MYPPPPPRVPPTHSTGHDSTPHHTHLHRSRTRGVPLARDDPSRRVRSPRRETTTTTTTTTRARVEVRRDVRARSSARARVRARAGNGEGTRRIATTTTTRTVDIDRMRGRMRARMRANAGARARDGETDDDETDDDDADADASEPWRRARCERGEGRDAGRWNARDVHRGRKRLFSRKRGSSLSRDSWTDRWSSRARS